MRNEGMFSGTVLKADKFGNVGYSNIGKMYAFSSPSVSLSKVFVIKCVLNFEPKF
jgi:hypothetical protein